MSSFSSIYPSPLSPTPNSVGLEAPVEPNYKKKTSLFLFNKFSKNGARFTHCVYTSCHQAPGWAGSWIKMWKICVNHNDYIQYRDYNHINNIVCSFENCSRKGVLGAHIMYNGSSKLFGSWYIVPACHRCNRKYGESARIKDDTVMVKVMKGRIFKKHKILVGSIDENEYNRVRDLHPLTTHDFEFNNSKKTKKSEFLANSAKNIRHWQTPQIGGWGWSRKNN